MSYVSQESRLAVTVMKIKLIIASANGQLALYTGIQKFSQKTQKNDCDLGIMYYVRFHNVLKHLTR